MAVLAQALQNKSIFLSLSHSCELLNSFIFTHKAASNNQQHVSLLLSCFLFKQKKKTDQKMLIASALCRAACSAGMVCSSLLIATSWDTKH